MKGLASQSTFNARMPALGSCFCLRRELRRVTSSSSALCAEERGSMNRTIRKKPTKEQIPRI